MAQAATHPRAISAHRPMAERYEALSKKHEPALVVSIGAAIRMSVAASSSIFQRHCCEETTDEGTAQRKPL